MKKLSKELRDERDRLQGHAQLSGDGLNEAVTTYNAAVKAAYEILVQELESHNNVLEQIREWETSCASAIEEYVSARSEKWLESDKASEYETWKEAFEQADFEDVEIEEPEEVSLDLPDYTEVLGERPEELGDN